MILIDTFPYLIHSFVQSVLLLFRCRNAALPNVLADYMTGGILGDQVAGRTRGDSVVIMRSESKSNKT
jgi:hypothetical protein